MKLRIGTRGSRLALTQTTMVIDALKMHWQDFEPEVIVIRTKGDKIQEVSLDKIGDKGLFVREIEAQLISGHIDMAVHSMKDMPFAMPESLVMVPVLKRADPRDVLVTTHQVSNIKELPSHLVIATGSKRRESQIRQLLPTVTVQPIRGNVETRIKKMKQLGYDGTILAAAGLKRLGVKSDGHITLLPLEIDEMIPAPGQGIIALQLRSVDHELMNQVKSIIHGTTAKQAEAERTFLKEVNGSCHLPMGAYLEISDTIKMHGLFGDESCHVVRRMAVECSMEDTVEVSKLIAKKLSEEVAL